MRKRGFSCVPPSHYLRREQSERFVGLDFAVGFECPNCKKLIPWEHGGLLECKFCHEAEVEAGSPTGASLQSDVPLPAFDKMREAVDNGAVDRTLPSAPLFFDLGPFEQTTRPCIADDWTEMPRDHPPVLCVVATTDVEYDAVVARLESAIGHSCVLQVFCGSVAMFVGKLGKYQVALLQTQMGTDATKEALLQVLPRLPSICLVLAIGVGYGLHPALESVPTDGQMIGDVMISTKCHDLSHYRATDEKIEPRGDVSSVQNVLLNALGRPVRDAWTRKIGNWGGRPRPPTVHVGTYVSLPVLFDSESHARPFVAAAAHLKPIGGDMELFQIASAVTKPGHSAKAWLAIKSICDFGGLIKKSKEGQPLAAATAVDFACYALRIPGFLDRLLELHGAPASS